MTLLNKFKRLQREILEVSSPFVTLEDFELCSEYEVRIRNSRADSDTTWCGDPKQYNPVDLNLVQMNKDRWGTIFIFEKYRGNKLARRHTFIGETYGTAWVALRV